MSRPQEVLLKRLCREPETLTKARVILHAAQLKTGPGTGYDLRGASTALPAICAYIASEELHIGDVTQKMAQNASCVTPKDFNVCLSVVRAALATADPRPQTRNRSSTYEGLVVRFKYTRGDFMVSCMRDAEKALIEGGQLRGRLRPPNEIITIAIFCWVCELLKLKKVQPTALIKEYGISPEDYKYVADVIRDSCDMVGKDIGRKVSDLRKEQKAAKLVAAESIPTATLAKSVSRTPSKSVLKSGSSYASSPTKTPSQKRKVVFSSVDEEDGSTLDTPTRKRPKLTNLLNPNHRTPHSNVLPALTFPSVDEEETSYPASSSKVMQDLLQATYDPTTDNDSSTDVDGPSSPSRSAPSTPRHPTHSTIDPVAPSDREQTPRKRKTSQGLNLKPPPAEDDEITRPRRCRPMLLSHRQWFLRDPRVEMEWRLAESAKQTLIQNHGHPFQHLGGPSMSMGTT